MSDKKGRGHDSPSIIPRSQHCVSRANISDNALKVLRRLSHAGFQSFLVGGCVRDLLLRHQPKDFDVATDASPDQVRKLFRNCRLVGRRFRLAHIQFGHEIIEVATFRSDSEHDAAEDERLQHDEGGMILRDNRFGSIEEDVWRRDFTANALYYTLDGYAIWDYTGGFADVQNRLLRVIGDPRERYREDPVRMLRAIRFAAKLDFVIEPASEAPLSELGDLLHDVPPARLFDETIKMLLTGHAVVTMKMLEKHDLVRHLFPAVCGSLKHAQGPGLQKMISEGLVTTDRRVVDSKPVAPFFLFAFLFWGPIRERAEVLRGKGLGELPAIQEATEQVIREQQASVSIPRRITTMIKETLTLQPRFERRSGPRVLRFLQHPRFRAAYDFMLLRAAGGEVDTDAASWWTEIQDASTEDKARMVKGSTSKGSQKKRRRRKNKSKRRPPIINRAGAQEK